MEQPTRKKQVLIVDDETDLAVVLAQRIGQAGFRVATACDGRDGLEKARFLVPDAVVLDVAMPNVDGWGFCAQARSDAALKDTPIIILTAWLTDDLKRRASAAGANGIMLKPYDEVKLVAMLRSLCAPPLSRSPRI